MKHSVLIPRLAVFRAVSLVWHVALWTLLAAAGAYADRTTISLNGVWNIEDSVREDAIPVRFTHQCLVPGLANLATPAFANVDAFISREHMANLTRDGEVPADWMKQYWKGKSGQERNYFWYQRTFKAPSARAIALLKISKAQFGTAVWLNGVKLGEYPGCFSASYFHLENAIHWEGENTLMIRVGAHPGVLPDTYPTGSDFEKNKWTPGIYDDVSVIFCDNPLIRSVQVAPDLVNSSVLVQTVLENRGPDTNVFIVFQVKTWKDGRKASEPVIETVAIKAGQTLVLTNRVAIPNAQWWSPEHPFLYTLDTWTEGDSLTTRFGMREFRFDGKSRRAWLNGKVYYLRGSNITLHRFFEDPLCQDLPWNEAWVRQLLCVIPKTMHWNYFRFCIGPVPDRWFDLCDEAGLLIQNEFFVWTGGNGWYNGYSRTYDADEMIRQYADWMRDHWNHPSVAVWDANNETKSELFNARIIPAVRPLDLSLRSWENSYNPPNSPNDPVEAHPYLMYSGGVGKLKFKMTDLETMNGSMGAGALPSDTNAPIINEYGWLWLNRDGSPTRLTTNLYPQLMGGTISTPRERLDLYAYLLAAKTEFWRAHRHFAGVIHFVYLTCSYPGVYTADHFQDVQRLKLDPAFEDYMGEAFKPLGVYINFFQPTLRGGVARSFKVMLVNDMDAPVKGSVRLVLETRRGREVAVVEKAFAMDSLGDTALDLTLTPPKAFAGPCILKAIARYKDHGKRATTTSRRWLNLETGDY
jgi:hypothetical protein